MKKVEKRQAYKKPEIKKHKSISVVSGSGGGGCNSYSSKTSGGYYYH